MRVVLLVVLSLVSVTASAQQPATPQESSVETALAPFREKAIEKWSKAIDEFDSLNQQQQQSPDSVLFIGSSSIRRWESLPTDLAPYRTIRRGYGGAKFTDMALFVDRIVSPHDYRAIVMFVGNGVVGKEDDHSPELIETLARHIVSVSQQHRPEAPFFIIEITPTEKRYEAWDKIRAVNAKLREVALTTPNTYFVPTASDYLQSDGTPRPELFVDDQLHLSDAGYQLWSNLIRRRLDDVLRTQAADLATDTP